MTCPCPPSICRAGFEAALRGFLSTRFRCCFFRTSRTVRYARCRSGLAPLRRQPARAAVLAVALADPVDHDRENHDGDTRLHALADIERLDAREHVFSETARADHR